MAHDRGPQVLGVLISLLVTSVVTGALRFYTHGVIVRRFFAEDYLTLVSLILYVVYTVWGCLAVQYGLGQHNEDVAPESRPTAIMYRWLASLLYIVISLLTKWSVGLFLLRICPRKRWRHITIWTILGFVTVFSILYFVFDLISCQPIEYEWTRYNPVPAEGTCNATGFATVTIYISSVLNIIADWVLPALPASLVWKSQMEPRVKVSVIALLALGSIASIATIVRIPYADGILDNPNYLYTSTDICIWSTVEIGVALTATSLATLKPLLRKLRLFNLSEVMSYGSASNRQTRDQNGNSTKRASHHVKSFSHGNNLVTISANPQIKENWGKKIMKRESMELSLVPASDVESNKSLTDKRSWLDM
ncbi:hypothetical protein VHEMI04609 [[Torrubiella] hemipterigena]|uniref:Rhodopsin domain-containing protein n=1 Tax=[Torrubiella] hemipterigena TaxID=1531966 RepID=A0A0A1TGS3_9HYPO|nr:hypothetical protein VHEMI04609 [[Torrubiella] hemipterigena]